MLLIFTIKVSPPTENGAISEVEPKISGQVAFGTLPSAEKTTHSYTC